MDTVTYRRGAYDALVALGIPHKLKGFAIAEKAIAAIAAGEDSTLQELYVKLGYDPISTSRNIITICKHCINNNSSETLSSLFGGAGNLTEKEFLTALAGRVSRGIPV